MRTKVYANVRWYTTYWIDLQIWYALISWLSFEWWVKCLQVLSVKPSNKVFIVLLHFPFKLYVRNKLQIIKVRVSCKENVACKHDWWRFKKGSSTCVYSFIHCILFPRAHDPFGQTRIVGSGDENDTLALVALQITSVNEDCKSLDTERYCTFLVTFYSAMWFTWKYCRRQIQRNWTEHIGNLDEYNGELACIKRMQALFVK